MRIVAVWLLLAAGLSAQDAFLVRFGDSDSVGRDWSGSVKVQGGRLLRLEPWQFDQGDQIGADGRSWTAKTVVEQYWHAPWERSLFGTKHQDRLSQRGVLLALAMDGAGEVSVETEQGDVKFRPAELGWGKERRFAGGAAVVSRSPAPIRSDEPAGEEDFVSALRSSDGSEWVAWQTYSNKGDQLWVKQGEAAPQPLTPPGRDLFRVKLAEGAAGAIWAVWCEQRGGNWDLFARKFAGGAWGAEEALTSDAGQDVFHALAGDGEGRLFLSWQSARDGDGEIYLRVHDGDAWGPEQKLSDDLSSDWEPTVAARNGRAAIVWDSYARGNYDIQLRLWQGGRLQPRVALTEAASFEARADAHFDRAGRLWLAWEEGDSQWGKDYVNGVYEAGMGLLMDRRVRTAVYEINELRELEGDFSNVWPAEAVFLGPRIATDGKGNPWVFFRYRTNTPDRDKPAYRSMWRTGAATYQGGRWSRLIPLPAGYGRIDAGIAVAEADGGGLKIWWPSDGREFPQGYPAKLDLYSASISVGRDAGELRFAEFEPPQQDFSPAHEDEVADVERLRAYRAEIDGRSLRIVRGDMHRHTDVSWDGNRDGSLLDSYRYAIDAAAMDYQGTADHNYGDDNEYFWWYSQKFVDLVTIAGKFTPLYGYERSRGYPSGHRNVMFAQRGVEVFPFSQQERDDNENAGVEPLYEHLAGNRGIVMVHTSATGAGTDWRDSNEAVEPLMEIYQGYRQSYEHEGAPRSTNVGSRPAGFVWKAWEKGIKLGLQSSSDHVSTHASYGMIFVEEVSREAILDGIRARRSYAATDNILVDFRVNGRMMGSAIESSGNPTIRAKVVGAGPIRKVEVIRNNTYVHTQQGGEAALEFEYVDNSPPQGENWYYIRVEQQDGELAWASPVWVTQR